MACGNTMVPTLGFNNVLRRHLTEVDEAIVEKDNVLRVLEVAAGTG